MRDRPWVGTHALETGTIVLYPHPDPLPEGEGAIIRSPMRAP